MKTQFATFLSAAVLAALTTVSWADGDAASGEKVFKKCKACHAVGENAKNKIGPALNGIFGRTAGTADGFKYSTAMTAKGEEGLVWTEDTLSAFLESPRKYVPKTKMAFAGLRKDDDREDLITYLKQFSPEYQSENQSAPQDGDKPVTAAASADEPPAEAMEEEGPAEFTEAILNDPQLIAGGGEIWGEQCRHCHGKNAYPGKAPKLKPRRYKPEFVFDRVTNGFRKMPAWKDVYSRDERIAIVAYVKSRKFSP